jgi:hypothetical protein
MGPPGSGWEKERANEDGGAGRDDQRRKEKGEYKPLGRDPLKSGTHGLQDSGEGAKGRQFGSRAEPRSAGGVDQPKNLPLDKEEDVAHRKGRMSHEEGRHEDGCRRGENTDPTQEGPSPTGSRHPALRLPQQPRTPCAPWALSFGHHPGDGLDRDLSHDSVFESILGRPGRQGVQGCKEAVPPCGFFPAGRAMRQMGKHVCARCRVEFSHQMSLDPLGGNVPKCFAQGSWRKDACEHGILKADGGLVVGQGLKLGSEHLPLPECLLAFRTIPKMSMDFHSIAGRQFATGECLKGSIVQMRVPGVHGRLRGVCV